MAGKLNALDVARTITPGKYPDGDGLYLVVAGPTSRNWSYRYWIGGKERWHGLGSLKDVSLKEARIKRDAARQTVRGGVDIVEQKRSARNEATATAEIVTAPTFKECAERYIAENRGGWSRKHAAQWPSSLDDYAYPTIGALRINEIQPSHIYDLLTKPVLDGAGSLIGPFWIARRETSNRVRGRIETVIAKNADINNKDFRNPAELTKQLREKLPKRPKRVVKHHPSLPYAEAPQFMQDLRGATGVAAAMLHFVIVTSCRTNEAIEARWSEIDRADAIWKIPGERMKMDQDHHVPLSGPALEILDEMRKGAQSELIFPNPEGDEFSENAMLAVLDRLGYGHVTVHGFRSTFATWAEEVTDYPDGVREAALAHKYKSETTAAYQRGQKLEKRRHLMQDWAAFIGLDVRSNVAQSA
jgi:integrase